MDDGVYNGTWMTRILGALLRELQQARLDFLKAAHTGKDKNHIKLTLAQEYDGWKTTIVE